MSNFMGLGIFWIGLSWVDLGCWRLTLIESKSKSINYGVKFKRENYLKNVEFLKPGIWFQFNVIIITTTYSFAINFSKTKTWRETRK